MYELSRVRLFSVGPRAARYHDVTLDLRDVGDKVTRPALFDTDPSVGGRRPSPATVLFLENGGGKSVLMKLIFSVMLPGRRNVVGSANTRVLEDFVLATDEAHVILEWQHTRTGERVITGKASEWRGHTVSADPNKFSELWYTFRPSSALNVDTLPLTVDGRKVTLAGFRDRLSQAGRAEPHLQLATSNAPGEWMRKLTDLDLDPELFRYQKAMNAGEGEAADAFSFKTDDAFVDFLLRAVVHEQDPKGLAEIVTLHARKLAQRGDLLAERGFVDGALQRLEPLAAAAQEAAAAADLAADARRQAGQFTASLQRRQSDDAMALESAKETLAGLTTTEGLRDQEQRRLGTIHLELRRLTAKLRWEQAERQRDDIRAQVQAAQALIDAWLAVDQILAWRAAAATAHDLQEIVHQQEHKARPALAARDAAARALARKLLAVTDAATSAATRLDVEAERLDRQAATDTAAAQDAAADAAAAATRLEGVEAAIADIHGAFAAAVIDGLIPSAAELPEAVELAELAWHDAKIELADLIDSLGRLSTEISHAETVHDTATKTHLEAQAEAGRLTDHADAARRRHDGLAAQARLAELLQHDTIDLDDDGPIAAEQLRRTVEDADTQLAHLRAQEVADARVREALGTSGLLPPSETVAHALAVLEREGVTAWAGWRYLAQLPAQQRQATIDRVPDLVDGIVVNSPDHLATAQQVLAAARLLPTTLIAVGTTAAMLHEQTSTAATFYLHPNPAMYDEAAADLERQRLAEMHQERTQTMAVLRARHDDDRRLLEQIVAWSTEFPAGALSRLDDEAATARSIADAAHEAMNHAKDTLDRLRRERKQLEAERPHRQAITDEMKTRCQTLARLEEQSAQLVTLAAEARAQKANVESATRRRDDRTRAAALAAQEALSVALQAGDQRRIASTSADELAGLTGAGSVSREDLVPDEPLQQLRLVHASARDMYLKVEVGGQLLHELSTAQQQESHARAAVEALSTDRRTHAEELALTPDAADAAAQAAAVLRARQRHTSMSQQLTVATENVGALRSEYQGYTAQKVSLEPYGAPATIEDGEDSLTEVEQAQAGARQAYEDARIAREALDRKIGEQERVHGTLAAVLESLADLAAETDADTPFTGDLVNARARRDELRTNLTAADRLHADAAAQARRAADALANFANAEQYITITSPVRRQIAGVERDRVAEYAVEWRDALRPRLRVLNDELTQLDEHRDHITTRLYGMVESALSTLRAAQRLSRLPAGLGDWSGQEFLRIRFTTLEPAPLRDRIATVVDEVTATPTEKSKPQRDGMSILLRAVHAALPKGVTVEMLKPDAVLRAERVRVAQISDVFSGGQLLTAAIILYCTMAALRSNERGRTQLQHAGVLFLDNPIGRASAGYLLDLQIHVAAALGVQLVYTTGLFDTTALSAFPLIIRMRNDADLRAGLKYLTIDSELRRPLDELEPADGGGTLTSTRAFIRPREAAE